MSFAQGPTGTGAGTSAVGTTIGSFTNPSAITADVLGNIFMADSALDLIKIVDGKFRTS